MQRRALDLAGNSSWTTTPRKTDGLDGDASLEFSKETSPRHVENGNLWVGYSLFAITRNSDFITIRNTSYAVVNAILPTPEPNSSLEIEVAQINILSNTIIETNVLVSP